jgi:hypothetical protein
VQTDDGRESVVGRALGHAHARQPECGVQGALLRPFELDLEGGTLRRGLAGEEFREIEPELARDGLQRGELRLPLAVLDE